MTQLVIDLHQQNFNPNVEAESVEAALGQFIAQHGFRYHSVHLHGKAAYVEFADSETAKIAQGDLEGMLCS